MATRFIDIPVAGNVLYGSVANVDWVGQTFLTPASPAYAISSVKWWSYRTGAVGTLTVALRATSGGEPTGGNLTTGTYNGDLLNNGAPATQFEVTMTAYNLAASTTYAVIIQPAGAGSLNPEYSDNGNPYSDGQQVESVNGGAWSVYPNYDFFIEVWGNSIAPSFKPCIIFI